MIFRSVSPSYAECSLLEASTQKRHPYVRNKGLARMAGGGGRGGRRREEGGRREGGGREEGGRREEAGGGGRRRNVTKLATIIDERC